ncbi:hypothetical protein ACHAXA_000870, partial [Cyclostephanos tholiformis]
ARRFLSMLTNLWVGVIQCCWNSEWPLVFQAVILHRVRGITRFHEVKPVIWGWLDAWDMERYIALVKVVKEAKLASSGGGRRVAVQRQDNATSLACQYDAMVLGGKVLAAVRMVTNRGTGGPYRPTNLDSKSGRPVIDVLWEKHPDCVVPSEWDFDAYPDAADLLDTMPVYCYEECVAKAAACLTGGAGPCGVEAEMLKHWLLCYSAPSELLRKAMAKWVDWLGNGSPPYAAYHAVKMVRTVALDKYPGIRPLGVGEVWMRLRSDCVHMKTKVAATNACGNTQLCAGLHAIWAIWPQITQGDCLAMSLYDVALTPLAFKMQEAIPKALQPLFCDNAGAAGKALPNSHCLDFLMKFGPSYGYFPEPGKSHYICKVEDKPALDSRLTIRGGNGTWAASSGAPRRRRSGLGAWSVNG